MAKFNDFFEKRGYFITLIIGYVLIILFFNYLDLPKQFYKFYEVNFDSINISLISFFGIVFGFLFTSLAILFSLGDNSYFTRLIKEHSRNQNDIINYFSVGIVSSLLLVFLALFLTITNVDSNISDSVMLSNSEFITHLPVYGVYYLTIFNIINLSFLVFVFIHLLKNK